jgi:gingipain R
MRNKRVSCIGVLIFSLLPLFANAVWVSFDNTVYGDAEVILLSSSLNDATFRVVIPGCELTTVQTSHMINAPNEVFSLLSIPHAYYTGGAGLPCLPAVKQTIGVPINADIHVEILYSTYTDRTLQSLNGQDRIMPVLEPVLKVPGEKPVFTLDARTYSQDAFYPSTIARVENDDIMRGHRLALLEIVPVQYDPVTGILRCYSEIVVKITFPGADYSQTHNRVQEDYSPVFEDFLQRRILNYDLYDLDDVLPLPIHYLIITHNSFQTQVNVLATWLKKKGFIVKVANQDTISSWTTSGIESYIDAQSPEPSYLLLVGDVNGGYMPAPVGSASGKNTDLYYAETDGSGYLPDIFHGRLSVESTTHITTVVDKILKYQKANLPAGWFKDCAFCAGNDNYTVSEGTHNYCTSTFMDPHGYTTYKLYEQTYGATTQDVADNVNAGRILTTMSGHGSDDGWYDGPQFTVTNVNQLTNGDHLTIATGHCCLANNFGSSTNPCGGESWIRKQNGGAVGYYGSCPSTYWDEDDWLQREWYEAVYADEIYEHGRFTEDGMYDGVYSSSSSMKQYY